MERTTLIERLRRIEGEIAAGRAQQALAACQEIQAEYPRALAVQRVLGEIYLSLRKPREAVGALDRALAGDPEDVRACCARAIVHQMHGDSMAALSWYRRACDLRPDDQALRSTYNELARHLGQPAYSPTRAGLARLYLRGGLYPHAIREWEQLVTENSDSLEAQVGLAETLWRAGHIAAAVERSRHILASAPACVKPILILLGQAVRTGDTETARQLGRRATDHDPDRRIAREFFADELSTDNPILRELFAPGRAASMPPASERRGVSRPLVGTGPLAEPLAEPLSASPSRGAASAPLPTGPKLTAPLGTSASATSLPASGLPPEFSAIFNETAYMIWSPEDETQKHPSGPSRPARPSSAVDTMAQSGLVMPPALREHGASLDDTEARAAINWVHWLQAQGAIAQQPAGASPTAAPRTQPPTQPVAPLQPAPRPAAAQASPQSNASSSLATGRPVSDLPPGATRDATTGPLPPPTPEALRAMFAELAEPGQRATGAMPTVSTAAFNGGQVAPGGGAPAGAWDVPDEAEPFADAGATREATYDTESGPGTNGASGGENSGTYGEPAPRSDHRWSDELAGTGWVRESELPDRLREDATSALESPGDPGADQPLTLEALDQRFAASGFHEIVPRPGLLAALAAEGAAGVSQGTAPHRAVTGAPAAVAPLPAPAPEILTPPQPAPDDYPARLALARQQRDANQLDDAVNEYRAVLRNAPELLAEVIADLGEALSQAPEHPEVHRLLGDARIRQGDYVGALEAYNRAMALAQAPDA